jgi:hypothetical protein
MAMADDVRTEETSTSRAEGKAAVTLEPVPMLVPADTAVELPATDAATGSPVMIDELPAAARNGNAIAHPAKDLFMPAIPFSDF